MRIIGKIDTSDQTLQHANSIKTSKCRDYNFYHHEQNGNGLQRHQPWAGVSRLQHG